MSITKIGNDTKQGWHINQSNVCVENLKAFYSAGSFTCLSDDNVLGSFKPSIRTHLSFIFQKLWGLYMTSINYELGYSWCKGLKGETTSQRIVWRGFQTMKVML